MIRLTYRGGSEEWLFESELRLVDVLKPRRACTLREATARV
jgi:hypothetical protein